MNNLNIPDDKLEALLGIAGKKLGQDPAALKSQLEQGKLDGILKNMDAASAEKVNGLLKNPAALDALMKNDAVKNMLSGILGGR